MGIVPASHFNVLEALFPSAERFAGFLAAVTAIAAIDAGVHHRVSLYPLAAMCAQAVASTAIFGIGAGKTFLAMAVIWMAFVATAVIFAITGLFLKTLAATRLLRFCAWLLLSDLESVIMLMFLRRDTVATPTAYDLPESVLDRATEWQAVMQVTLWALVLAVIVTVIWSFFAIVQQTQTVLNDRRTNNPPSTAA